MKKTIQMRLVEYEQGEKLETLLPDLFERLGTFEAVADQIGVHRVTLHDWVNELGFDTKVTRRTELSLPDSPVPLP